jgi:hypothetical protein
VYGLARHPDATLSLAFINESGLGFGGVFDVELPIAVKRLLAPRHQIDAFG